MNICLIPARGGSKRLPGKNIKPFAGKPMIAHSIMAAREAGLFEQVMCSTESDDIARVAAEWGAMVPFRRPAELADDHATTDQVIQHALHWLADHGGLPDYVCCVYATAPFITADDLKRGLDALKETGATTAFSVTSFAYSIYRALKINERGRLEMLWPEHRLKRSQDLPELLHDAGQFYWLNVCRYLRDGRLFSDDSIPVRLSRSRVQDIDTPEDWERAELMHRALHPEDSHG